MHDSGARNGTVWIAEEIDSEESFLLTGRFSGHLERDNRLVEEFDDLSVDDALSWGRARADVVMLRTGTSDYYSAGARNPDPGELPAWTPGAVQLDRRRVPGFEALDNTEADAPVLWDVRIRVDLSGAVDPRRFHDAVRRDPAARDVLTPAPGYPELSQRSSWRRRRWTSLRRQRRRSWTQRGATY